MSQPALRPGYAGSRQNHVSDSNESSSRKAPVPRKKRRSGLIIVSILIILAALFISTRKDGIGYAGIVCIAGTVLFLAGLTNKRQDRLFPNPYQDVGDWDQAGNAHQDGSTENDEDEFAPQRIGDGSSGPTARGNSPFNGHAVHDADHHIDPHGSGNDGGHDGSHHDGHAEGH